MNELGKRVADDLYVHIAAAEQLLGDAEWSRIRGLLSYLPPSAASTVNVVKLNVRAGRVSFLLYPKFNSEAFPQLAESWTMGDDGACSHRTYSESLNPPILHRKELLVPTTWPNRPAWVANTQTAEAIGLFDSDLAIGFRANWDRLVTARGYTVQDGSLVPIGNADSLEDQGPINISEVQQGQVQRHRTALQRTSLSAPVQLILRHALLEGLSLFDYGCGHGRDLDELRRLGYEASGWDPYFAPDEPIVRADIVNLGFVVNVIEDPAERAHVVRDAAQHARQLLAISVMLHSNSTSSVGVPYADGLLTRRSTFQKYFAQDELLAFVEKEVGRRPLAVAPGIAFVFFDEQLEQRYLASRYRRSDLAHRLRSLARVHTNDRSSTLRQRAAARDLVLTEHRQLLDSLCDLALELGRYPEEDEVPFLSEVTTKLKSWPRARSALTQCIDPSLLKRAAESRRDDLLLLLATQQFKKQAPFKKLETRLQRDIKVFFGTYGAAAGCAAQLLVQLGQPAAILEACRKSSEAGLGYLDEDHSLQLHYGLVERLPVLLRAYVACGLLLWGDDDSFDLVKIHVVSGKLTLHNYETFSDSPLPALRRRIKINLRKLSYEVFSYDSPEYPPTLLCFKSRYLADESPGYAEQVEFDARLRNMRLFEQGEFGVTADRLRIALEHQRLEIEGTSFIPARSIPHLDAKCGAHFTYRSFIECGETMKRTETLNVPVRPETFNALSLLARELVDPIIEYFGPIRLTYGFCSPQLAKRIDGRIAPELDQHASCEVSTAGRLICPRQGAACDFMVDDEDMREVAEWIIGNLPFDRLYFYGKDRPIHVSVGPENARAAFEMIQREGSRRVVPRRLSVDRRTSAAP